MFTIAQRDLFWLAGYLEGEGCFSLRRARAGTMVRQPNGTHNELKNDRLCFSIIASTTDLDVAEKVARIMRCRVSLEHRDKRGNRKPNYVVAVGRRHQVKELLTLLLPLMGERRSAKIRELLQAEAEHPVQDQNARTAWMRKFRKPHDLSKLPPRVRGRWAKRSDDSQNKLPLM